MNNREANRYPHPPACRCVECTMGKHGKWVTHGALCECEECLSHKFPGGRRGLDRISAEQIKNMSIKDMLPKSSKKGRNMGDFLKGFLGTLLSWILLLAGIALLLAGLFTGSIMFLVLAGICFAATAGIRYWLGHIVRIR